MGSHSVCGKIVAWSTASLFEGREERGSERSSQPIIFTALSRIAVRRLCPHQSDMWHFLQSPDKGQYRLETIPRVGPCQLRRCHASFPAGHGWLSRPVFIRGAEPASSVAQRPADVQSSLRCFSRVIADAPFAAVAACSCQRRGGMMKAFARPSHRRPQTMTSLRLYAAGNPCST